MKKITPFLWFDTQAEEAMNFYVSLFKNSKVGGVSRGPDGKAFSVSFELDGQEFMGMNAGPQFKFNEAVSMFVNCEDQAEVDYFWNAFIADGGEESPCAAGAKISMVCGGRSSRNSWAIILADLTQSKPSGGCKPCFKCTSSSSQI